MSSLRVVILAFDGVEALDFAGPFEVFTTASRVSQRMSSGTAAHFEVTSVALGKDEALAAWRADALRTVAIAFGLLMVIVVIGSLLICAVWSVCSGLVVLGIALELRDRLM